MRYISKHADSILLRTDGDLNTDYRFGSDGVLVIGSLTTDAGAGNSISSTGLQILDDTDLDGNTATCLEMMGMGSLTQLSGTLATLTNLEDGYRGFFFPAPILTGTDAVSGVAGIRYKVLTGIVPYVGVYYTVGEIFTTDGITTSTSGTGTFSIWLPTSIEKKSEEFLAEEFKIKSLIVGDEPSDTWAFTSDGVTERNSLVTTDPDFVGWTRS